MNVLVVYRLPTYPVRATVRDHLYSFRRYSRHRCAYLNLSLRSVPRWVASAGFDAVIFHTSFLSARWTEESFEQVRRRAQPLKGLGAVRVALPQDEFVRTRQLSALIEEFEVDHVCSVAPESEWPKIYAGVDRDRVRFHRVLTGYLDPGLVRRMDRLARPVSERALDIGYRARRLEPWVGRHGLLKSRLSDAVERTAGERGISTDLSTDESDALLGDAWYRFLGSSKYTIGAESGASLLDEDGSMKQHIESYVAANPDASFEQIEAACFPGRDGELQLVALGPRHLEACATRTCQILVEGHYNGILRAGEHYLALRPDLSNLGDVLDEVERDERRAQIVEAAHRDVVASGVVGYPRFVAEIEERCLAEALAGSHTGWRLRTPAAGIADTGSWVGVALRQRYRQVMSRAYPVAERRFSGPLRLARRVRTAASGARRP